MWNFLWALFFTVASAVLNPFRAPDGPTGATEDDFSAGNADEGTRVPKAYGSPWMPPKSHWDGHFRREQVTEDGPRRYGLFGPKAKIPQGFRYFLGVHNIVCSAFDSIIALKFDGKIGWRGNVAGGGQIRVNKEHLFGGLEPGRGGGVSGRIDVLDGNPNQQRNDYLMSAPAMGTDVIPAFRRVGSLVWRHFYWGASEFFRSPLVKPVAINVHGGNWYPEKARINPHFSTENNSIYIALDVSPSMDGFRLQSAKIAIGEFLRSMKGTRNNVMIVAWSGVVDASMQRLRCDDEDYDALATFVDGLTVGDDTRFDAGVELAPAFFDAAEGGSTSISIDGYLGQAISGELFGIGRAQEVPRRVVLFLTDGGTQQFSADLAVATLDSIAGVETYCFNVDHPDTFYTAQLDNTPQDGIPILSGTNANAIKDALSGAFLNHVDMNAAHIYRDVLIDETSGGDGDYSKAGASFTPAADLFYDEGFGLTIQWGSQTNDEFQQELGRHVDANVYRDRQTGLWEINPIRDNFDTDDLYIFGDGGIGIESWSDANKPEQLELPTSVTVSYIERETGVEGAVTLHNGDALRINKGVVRLDEVPVYRGISLRSLATRVCERDLRARTLPLRSGAFYPLYLPIDINLGTPIIVADPTMWNDSFVARVTEIVDSDGRDNRVLVKFLEDKFGLPLEVLIEEEEISQPNLNAQPSDVRLVEEMPYRALTDLYGQTAVDVGLATSPGAGQFHATGQSPSETHEEIQVTTSEDGGTNWIDSHRVVFASVATLKTNLSRAADDRTADIEVLDSLGNVAVGSLCLIGSEYLRVDGMEVNGSLVTVTFGRGCLDTVPVEHVAESNVIFWEGATATDDSVYQAAEVLDVRLRPITSQDILQLDDAPNDQITFASRAIRPYPPGDFKVDGEYSDDRLFDGSADLTWSHRDRKQQTTGTPEDHSAGNIGPESGVTYQVRVKEYDNSDTLISTLIDTNVGSVTSHTVAPTPSAAASYLTFEVVSLRDGYESWQVPVIRMTAAVRTTESGIDRTTEAGSIRTLE